VLIHRSPPAAGRAYARSRAAACVAAAVLGWVALTGCGGDGGSSGPGAASSGPASAASGNVEVLVQNFAFKPQNVTVPVGATVTWKFEDQTQHNVTAGDGSFKSGDLTGGKTFAMTFKKAGKVPYMCTIHPFMTGTVTVQ
jgi:plastocyanin